MQLKFLLQNAQINSLMFHTKILFAQNLCIDLLTFFSDLTMRNLNYCHFFFFFVSLIYQIKVCLVFYLLPLITSTLCKRRGCYDVCCYVCFCSSNGYTEDGTKITVQHANNDQRPMYYWPIATI